MIDHIACTPGMKSHWIRDSSSVLYADKWISNYGNVVSDHFPVFSRFSWESPSKSLNSNETKLSYSLVLAGEDLLFSEDAQSGLSQQNRVLVFDMLGRLYTQTMGNRISNVTRDQWFTYVIKSASGEIIRTGMFFVEGTSAVFYR
jgi:hypothetical protein